MRTKILFIFVRLALLLLCAFFVANSQSDNESKLILDGKNKAKLGSLQSDSTLLLEAHKIFNGACQLNPKDSLAKYYLSYTEYLLISLEYSKKSNGYFEKYYDSSVNLLEGLIKEKVFASEANALLALLYMTRISKKPGEAPMLSMQIADCLDIAENINPDNPRVFYLKGLMKAKTPAMFGGSPEGAIQNFKKAISTFEKKEITDEKLPDWGYLESHAFLGMTLVDQKQFEEAEFIYKKALQINPDYAWIKYRLLPELEKKKASNK